MSNGANLPSYIKNDASNNQLIVGIAPATTSGELKTVTITGTLNNGQYLSMDYEILFLATDEHPNDYEIYTTGDLPC